MVNITVTDEDGKILDKFAVTNYRSRDISDIDNLDSIEYYGPDASNTFLIDRIRTADERNS